MPKRSSSDVNRIAANVVEQVTGERVKDPAAVSLGRRGGLKGGPARAATLSAKRRSEIARTAAKKRWQREI